MKKEALSSVLWGRYSPPFPFFFAFYNPSEDKRECTSSYYMDDSILLPLLSSSNSLSNAPKKLENTFHKCSHETQPPFLLPSLWLTHWWVHKLCVAVQIQQQVHHAPGQIYVLFYPFKSSFSTWKNVNTMWALTELIHTAIKHLEASKALISHLKICSSIFINSLWLPGASFLVYTPHSLSDTECPLCTHTALTFRNSVYFMQKLLLPILIYCRYNKLNFSLA